MTLIPWCVALSLVVAGCSKGDGAGSKPKEAPAAAAPAPLPAGFVEVPEHPTLIVEVPAGATPMDGLPGFKTADKSFSMLVQNVRPDDSADIPTLKKVIAEHVKTWIREETTSDGFILTYATPKVEMNAAGTLEEVGLEYGLVMHRTIGGTRYKCNAGTVTSALGLDAVVKACNSIRLRG